MLISYRPALKSDFNLMKEIENKSFNQIDRFKEYQIKHFLNNPNNSIYTDIILLDKNPIGWATYFTRKNQNFIRLYTFCINPDFRGKGYGKQYLTLKLYELKKTYKKIFLEVRKSNTNAIKLYENLGFKKVKILKDYYLNEDGIKMLLTL